MHRWLFESRKQSWIAFAIVILLLAAAALALARQQFTQDMQNTQSTTVREVELLGAVIGESLRRGQYQNVEQLLSQWGASNDKLAELTVTAQNGSILGQYRRGYGAKTLFSASVPIAYSYRGQATLAAMRDMTNVYKRHNNLLMQLLAAFLALTLLLGLLMHFVFQRQKEAALLRTQTTRLDAANALLQNEVTQRRQAEEALFEAKERAEVTLHSIGDAVITTDQQGLVTYLNPVAEELTGWSLADATGRRLAEVFHIVNESTREVAENPAVRCLREGTVIGLANHTVLIARDGSERAIEDSAAPIRARDGRIAGVVMVFHDVTQSRTMAQQLSWNASHDALTGLLNRREFEERVRRALHASHVDDERHALLYVDLDQFKIVNDTCGHVAGDELLRQLSSLLQRQMRTTDVLARLGGDEFGVLLEHCPIEQATRVAEQLRDVTRQFRFMWDQKTFDISASIGVMPIHRDSGTLPQLLSAVDMACYVAKERGRNRYHVYQESDVDFARRHGEILWVTRINQALREHHFVLYRQAIQSTRPPHGIHHYEVLLRIRNEDGTLSEPGSFLPAAERYDLMTAIDRWVITNLFLTQADTLRAADSDLEPPTMAAINLSGASLNDETFLDFVRATLAEYAINPRQICFEITETVAISHLDQAINFITALRQLGCRFALDDFGSGLSSFGYLKNLPVDFLKIDGSLVRNVVDSPVDAAMVQAVHEIGHVMGLKTIAEYVENETLRQRLIEMGVDYMQGFAIEMPRPFAPIPAGINTQTRS
jgi:diguanylate cyclase (GGDEF)-like protein/PAS domain S-box-containing protein